jgi:hypothetical protein
MGSRLRRESSSTEAADSSLTFAEEIEYAAGGEPISAIAIGPFARGDGYGEDRISRAAPVRIGQLLKWEEARPMLDYEFDRNFGQPQCDAIHAWTENKVLFVYEHDGATQVLTIPRNPTPDDVRLPGAI